MTVKETREETQARAEEQPDLKRKVPKLRGVSPAYFTKRGAAYVGDSRELLKKLKDETVNLVITSPPFALLRKKSYGNESQAEYVDWLASFAEIVKDKLTDDGSFVVDLGGAYEKGSPSRSLYNFRVALKFVDDLGFILAEDFYWFNPSKLPSPIEWVNIRKMRAKDSVNTVWWFAKSAWTKSNVSNVLTEYSDRMKKLIKDPDAYFDAAKRPSGHDITKKFGKDNGGAIPSNLLQIPNSESNGQYTSACKTVGVKCHPARFPEKLPEFFIKFLTKPNDLVVDIFAGSNTTGQVAQKLERRWLGFEESSEYVAASAFRFLGKGTSDKELQRIFAEVQESGDVDLCEKQGQLFAERRADYVRSR